MEWMTSGSGPVAYEIFSARRWMAFQPRTLNELWGGFCQATKLINVKEIFVGLSTYLAKEKERIVPPDRYASEIPSYHSLLRLTRWKKDIRSSISFHFIFLPVKDWRFGGGASGQTNDVETPQGYNFRKREWNECEKSVKAGLPRGYSKWPGRGVDWLLLRFFDLDLASDQGWVCALDQLEYFLIIFFFFLFFVDSSAGDIREAVGSEDYDLLVRAIDLFFFCEKIIYYFVWVATFSDKFSF